MGNNDGRNIADMGIISTLYIVYIATDRQCVVMNGRWE